MRYTNFLIVGFAFSGLCCQEVGETSTTSHVRTKEPSQNDASRLHKLFVRVSVSDPMPFNYVVIEKNDQPRERPIESPLTPEEQETVRESVYRGRPLIGGMEFPGILLLPEPLVEVYKEKPAAVMTLLLEIVDDSSPHESALAAAYAIAFQSGPRVATAVFSGFEPDKYDLVNEHWKVTPREHWINSIKKWNDG